MKNERKSLFVIVTILTIAVLGLSIAYAALSTTLTARFSEVAQQSLRWEVGFVEGSVAGVGSGTSDAGRTCGVASVSQSSASVAETILSKPGDKCTYALTIKNTGTIDANLGSINPTQPSSVTCTTASGATMVCGNLTYKITTDAAGTTVLTPNRLLEKSTGELPVYLVVAYTGDEVSGTQNTQAGAAFTLTYNQA
jgi:uncharacterized repeat protein (TIGR01451 family)